MEKTEFATIRHTLNRTQKEMAGLLGTSIKAIHSYEQGWRKVPVHAERQLLFLLAKIQEQDKNQKTCWSVKKCPPEKKKRCPAWEFKAGKLCWFINGTICDGTVHNYWSEKMKICRPCEVFSSIMDFAFDAEKPASPDDSLDNNN
jgi:DNA-binding XRE family transcriptional regulator